MAISQDRLGLNSLTNMVKKSYSTASDTADILAARATETASEAVSILDKQMPFGTNDMKSALGIFGDTICNTNLDLNLRMDDHLLSLLRDINFGFNFDICDNAQKQSPLDGAISKIKPLSIPKALISGKNESILDNFITAEGRSGFNVSGINSNISDCFSTGVKGKLNNLFSTSGASAKSKLNLSSLLNSACDKGSTVSSGVNKLLSTTVASNMIDNMSKVNIPTALSYVGGMLSSEDSQESVLNGFNMSLHTKGSTNTLNKLIMVSSASKNVTDPVALTYLRGDLSNILSNVDDSEINSNSVASNYKQITESFDVIDPNWNKDQNGNVTAYKVKDNPTMDKLAKASLAFNVSDDNLTEEPKTTEISPTLAIAITNTSLSA